jgi:hypothetical protein
MPTIQYTDSVRRLAWTEDVQKNGVDAALLDAAAKGETARVEAIVAMKQRTARVNLLVLRFAATLALLAIRARERANAPSGAAAKAAVARNADQAKRQRRE